MTYRSGRHFLQIPGPTNVPDRVLRAIDRPTIDHRGPEFARLGRRVLDGLQTIMRRGFRSMPSLLPAIGVTARTRKRSARVLPTTASIGSRRCASCTTRRRPA